MLLSDLFTENFFANPKSPNFVEQLESASEFFKAELPKNVNRKKMFTFVALMYDPASELRKNIANLPQRKTLSAITSGFALNSDNKFSEEMENVLIGKCIEVNRMIAEYCLLAQNMDFTAYTAYTRIFIELVAMSHQSTKKDTILLIGNVRGEIEKIERKMFAGDEAEAMRKQLYLASKSISLNLQMEDIVERIEKGDLLAEFNPYGDYQPNKLTYAGDEIPKE
jgi:hypothetical protein